MKGIILAGGSGSRLYPTTVGVGKQLLPVYDKPMIYYPITNMITTNVYSTLIITTKEDQSAFKRLLGDGSQWGINLEYAVQDAPNGIAEAFIIGEKFIGDDSVCLMLGDNIFHGQNFRSHLLDGCEVANEKGAAIFAHQVKDPERYGVVDFDRDGNAIHLEEKPKQPRSNFAVPGLYFYDNQVCKIAKEISPSKRGELEITDINQKYLDLGQLKVRELGRGTAWLDAGTHASLLEASSFVATLQTRQGVHIACPEEAAYSAGRMSLNELEEAGVRINNFYGKYLLDIVKQQRKTLEDIVYVKQN